MKKRGGVLLVICLSIILASAFILANNHTEQAKIDSAYSCLQNKVSGNCDSLSLQEKTFSLLSVNQCQSELISDSQNSGECWPSGSCNVRATAQAALALDSVNSNTGSAESWLLSKNITPSDVNWYLEIDSQGQSACTIGYSTLSYTITVNEDKTLSGSAGSCLSLSQDGYWLRISSSCEDETFSVSCDQDFVTTLLFQESGEETIHVTGSVSSASAQGLTTENVESSCFSNTASSCDYEATLWAALALDVLGNDVESYLPYLIVNADENPRSLPDAFLYFLTGNEDYRNSLLLKQKSNQYWLESGDRFYDTAMALYPLQSQNIQEKTNAKTWLLTAQDSEGCWEGNVRNTAFILASAWPKNLSGSGGTGLPDCEASNFYCMSGASCQGQILSEYDCTGSLNKCCSEPQQFETCSELNGEICATGEFCSGGSEVRTGIAGNELCCVSGFCKTPDVQPSNECDAAGNSCRFECESGETQTSESCGTSAGVCCAFTGFDGSSGSYTWVWILLALIILVSVGIVFRDKLRMWWLKLRGSKGKGPGSSGFSRPGSPPHFPHRPSSSLNQHRMRYPERKILLPSSQPQPSPAKPQVKPFRKSRTQKELDEVLRKLKDMGK